MGKTGTQTKDQMCVMFLPYHQYMDIVFKKSRDGEEGIERMGVVVQVHKELSGYANRMGKPPSPMAVRHDSFIYVWSCFSVSFILPYLDS